MSGIKENGKKETEYRWFEVPEGFHEKSNTVNSKFELGRMVITANANKELDIPSVLQILLLAICKVIGEICVKAINS